jgi:hypothetical protein
MVYSRGRPDAGRTGAPRLLSCADGTDGTDGTAGAPEFAGHHREQPFLISYPMALPRVAWDFERATVGCRDLRELDAARRRTGVGRPRSLSPGRPSVTRSRVAEP